MKKLRTTYLNTRFKAAAAEFSLALLKSASVRHSGMKGGVREEALRSFFRDRLPKRYAITEGEVVDLLGNVSPQMDLMIFDQDRNFRLNADNVSILPAEALLATVEVKSSLTVDEIEKSVLAAKKLRNLKPFGKVLAGRDNNEVRKAVRFYHCIFAYESTINQDWLREESKRVLSACSGAHLIDAVYVLKKGFINVANEMGRPEDDEGGAITAFYFSILNFIEREAGRRTATPYESYFQPAKGVWTKL